MCKGAHLIIHSFVVFSFIQSQIFATEWIGMSCIFKDLTVHSIWEIIELLYKIDPQHRASASTQQWKDERTFLWLLCGGDCLCLCKTKRKSSDQLLYFQNKLQVHVSTVFTFFVFVKLSALTAQDLAEIMRCDRSSSSSGSNEVWKLLLSEASGVLDEALDLLANSVWIHFLVAFVLNCVLKEDN